MKRQFAPGDRVQFVSGSEWRVGEFRRYLLGEWIGLVEIHSDGECFICDPERIRAAAGRRKEVAR